MQIHNEGQWKYKNKRLIKRSSSGKLPLKTDEEEGEEESSQIAVNLVKRDIKKIHTTFVNVVWS